MSSVSSSFRPQVGVSPDLSTFHSFDFLRPADIRLDGDFGPTSFSMVFSRFARFDVIVV